MFNFIFISYLYLISLLFIFSLCLTLIFNVTDILLNFKLRLYFIDLFNFYLTLIFTLLIFNFNFPQMAHRSEPIRSWPNDVHPLLATERSVGRTDMVIDRLWSAMESCSLFCAPIFCTNHRLHICR